MSHIVRGGVRDVVLAVQSFCEDFPTPTGTKRLRDNSENSRCTLKI